MQLQVEKTKEKAIESVNMLSRAEDLFKQMDIAEATREDYLRRIPLFISYIKANDVSINTYLDYKRYLADLPYYSTSTKNKYLVTARILLKELNRIGMLKQDITQNIKGFKHSNKHKKDGINDKEMQIILKAISELPKDRESVRLKAILSLLTLQGLRQVELIRLSVKDIDIVEGTALVLGKGRDDKEIIYLHPEAVRTIKEYMNNWKIKDGPLFISRSGNSKNKRLTTRSLRRIVKNFLTGLGINKTTHGFRHYFTTTLIKTYKGDLTEVSRYTRHKSLEMLQVYNDRIILKADLPRFYGAFNGVSF